MPLLTGESQCVVDGAFSLMQELGDQHAARQEGLQDRTCAGRDEGIPAQQNHSSKVAITPGCSFESIEDFF